MNKRLAIIFPNKSSSSETFIKGHVDNLPGEKKLLYGGWFPTYSDGDKLITEVPKKGIFKRLIDRTLFEITKTRNEPSSEKALLEFLKKNKIDAVLAEYGPTGTAVMNVCIEARIPLIVHFHGFDAYHAETLDRYRHLYIDLFQKASAIVVVSKHMKEQIISLGASENKVHYNPYGVDISKFKPIVNTIKEPRFLFVGRFVNKKAPHLLILAFSRVIETISNAKLVMIGDGGLGGAGELFMACKELVLGMKLSHAVEFRGAMTHEEVVMEMQRSYAYVQHSVRPEDGDSEGTPNSVLEAGACGLAVISTKHAGISDIVVDGETGFLVDEYDVDGMARKMIELAENNTLNSAMGYAARQRLVSNFSMDKSIAALNTIIENAISLK
jgi:colanic acid/amylovoran biosynthesis glycosyltransferase